MKTLMKYIVAGVLLGYSAFSAAYGSVSSVTIDNVQLTSNDGALIYVKLQNNQFMQDCPYNALRLTNLAGDFQKQAYATLLTAKLNGLVVSNIGYNVTSPNFCEISQVML